MCISNMLPGVVTMLQELLVYTKRAQKKLVVKTFILR